MADGRLVRKTLPAFSAALLHLDREPTLPSHERGDRYQHDDKENTEDCIYLFELFEILNDLRSSFSSRDSAAGHDQSQLHVHIAANQMLSRSHDRLSDDVRQVRADHKIHWHTRGKQSRTGQKTAADAEEPPENSHDESQDHQIDRIEVLS